MKRYSLRIRLSALFAAGMFLATMAGDAFGAHKCPHHDLLPVTPDAVEPGAHGHAHAPSHDDATQQGAHTEDAGHGPCTCIGHCTVSGTAAVTKSSARVRYVEFGNVVRPRVSETNVRTPERPRFLLPFATAPPVPFTV